MVPRRGSQPPPRRPLPNAHFSISIGCTLRGFTCSVANVDPKTATPAEIAKIRKIQIGLQVDGVTGGLAVKDQDKSKK